MYKVPRIAFVNKMDKIGADFFNCVKMIKERTGKFSSNTLLLPEIIEGLINNYHNKWVWDSKI